MPNNSNRTKQITAIVSLLCFLASMNLPPALAQQALSGNPAPTIFGPHGPVSLSPLGTVAMPISVGRTHPSTFTPPSSSAAAPQFSPATFGASANAASGMQLDLSSAINNVVVDQNLLRGRSVMINVGGKTQAVSAGMNVTPAEFVAIEQALAGRQSLVLDTNGAAVGGNFRLNGIVTPSSGGIVIPAGVKGIDVAGSTSALKLSGNLVNFGSLFAVAGAPAVNTATIAANDINNELGATISSVAANAGLGLSQARPLSLVLNAAGDISNAGTITSSGALRLVTGSGNITNTGSISALGGNITLATASPRTDLNVNAIGGTFDSI